MVSVTLIVKKTAWYNALRMKSHISDIVLSSRICWTSMQWMIEFLLRLITFCHYKVCLVYDFHFTKIGTTK